MESRSKMPYEEDKLQGLTEEENHEKKREKKKPLALFI